MHVEQLSQRIVELVEGAQLPHLDAESLVAALAVVLAGAGLVRVGNYALGNRNQLLLLVAEPFPRLKASLRVVPALAGVDETLTARIARHAEHPAVDGLVVVSGLADNIPRPGPVSGVPIRVAVAGARTGTHASRSMSEAGRPPSSPDRWRQAPGRHLDRATTRHQRSRPQSYPRPSSARGAELLIALFDSFAVRMLGNTLGQREGYP